MIATLVAFLNLSGLPAGPVLPDGGTTQGGPQKTAAQAQFEKEIENDKKIGKEAADEYDKQYKPTKDIESQKRVEEIGAKLALIANANEFDLLWGDRRHSEFEYKFKVVDTKDVNAFSLPGGYIYVFQGLVDFCQSDDELAGVLAHEINHASQRHVATMQKEQSKFNAIQIPLILASIFAKSAVGLESTSLLGTAVTNGWGVKAETSADYGGVQLMVAAGYDATGMLTFMERLQAKDGIGEKAIDLGILRTHPPSRLRAEKIEAYMKKNLLTIHRSLVAFDFRVNSKTTDQGQITLFFGRRKLFTLGEGGQDRAQSLTKKLNSFFDKVPEMYEVTTGDEGVIYAKNQRLITLTPADAKANSLELEPLQNAVAKAIRSSIFSLAYHIWEGRS